MAVPFFFSLLLMLVKILHFPPPWLKMCGRLGSSFSSWRSKKWYPFCRWWKMKGVGGFFSRLCERTLSVGGGGLLSFAAGPNIPCFAFNWSREGAQDQSKPGRVSVMVAGF